MKIISKFENSEKNKQLLEHTEIEGSDDLEIFFTKELNNFKTIGKSSQFYNTIKELKFKISQLLKFLRLKKIFIKNALNIDLKDFDYENLNVNAIIEIFIVKKFNLDMIKDINDFYSKTTDIREALGLSWDEYLIELSSIFLKYKMHDMYANILNVFFDKNYITFEKCLLNMKKEKSLDLMNFIFEKKFELKIIENSQNITLINQINDYLSNKNKIGKNIIDEKLSKNEYIEDKKSKLRLDTLSPDSELDKSEFFLYLEYSNTKNKIIKKNLLENNFNFKKDFIPEKEYFRIYDNEKEFKDNFKQFMDVLSINFDLEKFYHSRHLKSQVDTHSHSYSLHPKLIELLDKINFNFRGQEFKLNTNISLKAKLYKKILSKNFSAVENILQWENFTFDLKNVKNLKFLEIKNNITIKDSEWSDESNLIVTAEDEKIFYLFNLLSLIFTEENSKFDLIFENLTNIFIDKFESLYVNAQNETYFDEENVRIKNRFVYFMMDSFYFTLKHSKSFNYSNLLFWRTFLNKLIEKLSSKNTEKFIKISKVLIEIQKEFLHFIAFDYSEKTKTKLSEEEFIMISKKADFVMESIQKISHLFNILILFGEGFMEKYDFKYRIRNFILKPEIEEYSNKYYFFRNLINDKKGAFHSSKNQNKFSTYDLNFICNIFKNLTLNNVFNFIKIFDSKVLIQVFKFNENSKLMSGEFLNIKHLLGIKLINNLNNISGFMNVDTSLSFLVFNYLKNYIYSDYEFREIVNELLYVPKFNILLDSSSNIMILEKNLNHIVKDYFETKINLFEQTTKFFKDKFKLSPIAEAKLKLIRIKKFICDSFNSNLRNVFSDISELEDYQELENYIKDERFKKEIYKIYSSS